MRKLHPLILLAVGAFAISGVASGADPGEDDFNAARLRSGQVLFDDKKYLEAIDQFRVAAFGYLAKPASLSESLVRLALAQMAAARPADADDTILRFLEVERRFPSFPAPGLQPELQAEFRSLLLRRVPQGTLLSIPSLAGLVETEEQKIAKLPPAERRKALEAAARSEPGAAHWPLALAREAMDRSDAKSADRWASKALALEPSNPEALALRARARFLRGDLAEARSDLAALPASELEKRPELYADQLVALVDARDWAGAGEASLRVPANLASRGDVVRARQKLAAEAERRGEAPAAAAARPAPGAGKPAPAGTLPVPAASKPAEPMDPAARSREAVLEARRLVQARKSGDALRVLTEALRADPGNRELRLTLLEAACLSRSYTLAAAQLPLVTPLSDNEPTAMFYAAVTLFETGKTDEARAYLQKAIPKVSGPLADEYARKILGR